MKKSEIGGSILVLILIPISSLSMLAEYPSIAEGDTKSTTNSDGLSGMSHIFGKAFGNNGNAFSAFVECSAGKYQSFDKGSLISFSSILTNEAQQKMQGHLYFDTAVGAWQIEYGKSDDDQLLYQGGSIIGTSFQGSSYLLYGVETRDDVCGTEGEDITIESECTNNTPVKYLNSIGDSSGSTVPPDFTRVYHFFSSEVTCK
jgi:hypothetical protein